MTFAKREGLLFGLRVRALRALGFTRLEACSIAAAEVATLQPAAVLNCRRMPGGDYVIRAPARVLARRLAHEAGHVVMGHCDEQLTLFEERAEESAAHAFAAVAMAVQHDWVDDHFPIDAAETDD